MKSPAHDIALFLAGLGVIGGFAHASAAWAVFVGSEPAPSRDTVTIYDTGGEGPDTDELNDTRPTFQVRVRAADYPAGYAKQEAIRDALILPGPIVCDSSQFSFVVMSGDILSIGLDDKDRAILVANYRARRTAKG